MLRWVGDYYRISKNKKNVDFTSSMSYRYRQTPNYHIGVKAHAISVSIRAFTLDSS